MTKALTSSIHSSSCTDQPHNSVSMPSPDDHLPSETFAGLKRHRYQAPPISPVNLTTSLTFSRVTCVYPNTVSTRPCNTPVAVPSTTSSGAALCVREIGVRKSNAAQARSSMSIFGATKPTSEVGEGGSCASSAVER